MNLMGISCVATPDGFFSASNQALCYDSEPTYPCKKNFRNERLTLAILGLALCLEFTKALTNLRKKVINKIKSAAYNIR